MKPIAFVMLVIEISEIPYILLPRMDVSHMEETFESWEDRIRGYLDEFGEVTFSKTDAKNVLLYRIKLLTTPYRIEYYNSSSDDPSTSKTYTSEEAFFKMLNEEVYSDPYLSEPVFKPVSDKRRFFLFELSKGYPRGFDMEKYTDKIQKTIERINATHNNFNITGVEIFGDSFELAVEGDYPGWQVHFIRYLVDKTDLTEFRDDMATKSILSYTEIDQDYMQEPKGSEK